MGELQHQRVVKAVTLTDHSLFGIKDAINCFLMRVPINQKNKIRKLALVLAKALL